MGSNLLRVSLFGLLILSAVRSSAADIESAQTPTPAATTDQEHASARRLGGFTHVSQRVLHMLLQREVRQNQTILETVLRMTTWGTAYAECHIGLELVPNRHMANVRLVMTGRAIMDDAVSTMRKIRVHSSSYTNIRGHKDVLFAAEGLKLAPAQAYCSTAINVHNIQAHNRLVERLAWRQVGKKQPQAEQSAAERAARRAEEQLEAEAGSALADLHRDYVQNVYQPLSQRGIFPDLRFVTTEDHLSMRFYHRADRAADDEARQAIPAASYDIAFCLNDQFLNKFLKMLLGGKTLHDEQFAELMLTLTGKTPRPLWVHARQERWQVQMADDQPLWVSFSDDLVTIRLRMEELTRGDKKFPRRTEVTAAFRLEITPDGPRLAREGEVQVAAIGASNAGNEVDAELDQFLRRKFGGVFVDELYFDGLTPPAGGTWGKLRRLELRQLAAQDGWFAIGYTMLADEVGTRRDAAE